jgi:O-antigen/teichoic acid export membrane protein
MPDVILMIHKIATFIQTTSPNLRQILSNTSWLLADRLLQMLIGLFIGVWVARYLGPEQFGLYNYATSLVIMASPLASMGLDSLIVRDISQNISQRDEILGTAFVLSFTGGIATVPLVYVMVYLLNPGETLIYWLTGVLSLGALFKAFNVVDYWFQAQIQSKYIVVSKRFAYLATVILRIILIYAQAPLIAFAISALVELVLSSISVSIAYIVKAGNPKHWKVSYSRAIDLAQEGAPLVFAGFAVLAYSKIDQIMLGALLSDKTQLGLYSTAVKIAEIPDFIPVAIAASVFPKLSQAKFNQNEYIKRMQVYFDIMIWLWFFTAIPISFFSSFIVSNLYGDSYSLTSNILSIYIWGQFGTHIGIARNSFLVIESKLKYSLYLSIAGGFINIAVNFFLIPEYGAIGATVATLITYFSVTVLANFLFKDLEEVGAMIFRSLNFFRATSRIRELMQ